MFYLHRVVYGKEVDLPHPSILNEKNMILIWVYFPISPNKQVIHLV